MKVAIHQPNFIPWIGYFKKMQESDIFIYYDNVRKDEKLNYEKRVQVHNANDQLVYLGLPIKKVHKDQSSKYPKMSELEIMNENENKIKITRKIESYFQKYKYYKENIDWLMPVILNNKKLLADFNITIIEEIKKKMEISVKTIRSRELNAEFTGNKGNIELVKKVGGKTYISGNGADIYQEPKKFASEGLNIKYSDVNRIKNTFNHNIIGVSVIELIFQYGLEFISETLRKK